MSRRVITELFPHLPDPVMLIGGWGVYFTVERIWQQTFGEAYFGSRDIDLGFHVPRDKPAADLRRGNLPLTVEYLAKAGFLPENMYQFLRYHDDETDARLEPEKVRDMASFRYYAIAVDLIVDNERADIRDIAGFQAFAEPLLEMSFVDPLHRRELNIDGAAVHVPSPHALIAMKLRSLPNREKNDKSIKDLCDLYALVTSSGDSPRTLRSRLARVLPESAALVRDASNSVFLGAAAKHLEVRPELVREALGQLE